MARYRFNDINTLWGGFFISGEQYGGHSLISLLPISPPATCSRDPTIPSRFDAVRRLGWLLGVYVQDEWKITSQLTLNAGLRFDQMYQFVDANQFSPRFGLVYKPFDGTTLHAGYARYFTPPSQVLAGPTNVAAFDNTTQASQTCGGQSPTVQPPCGAVLPERSHYFDVGVVQRVLPGLDSGSMATTNLRETFSMTVNLAPPSYSTALTTPKHETRASRSRPTTQ